MAINCDPNSLALAARCFCFDSLTQERVSILLICEWANGGGGGCEAVAATDLTPGTPDTDSTTVGWTLASDPLLDFVVLWGTVDGGPYPNSDTVAANLRSYEITGLDPDTVYFFVVRSRDALDCTATSSQQTFTTTDPCEDAVAVTGFASTGTERGNGEFSYVTSFTWDAYPFPDDVAFHTLLRSDAIGGPYSSVAAGVTGAETSVVDSGDGGPVLPQTTYFYKIETVFQNAFEGCPTAETAPIEVATGCHVAAASDLDDVPGITDAQITWTISAPPLLDYFIEWGEDTGGPYPNNDTVSSGQLSYLITGLTASTTYFYVLTVRDTETCTVSTLEGTFTTEPE